MVPCEVSLKEFFVLPSFFDNPDTPFSGGGHLIMVELLTDCSLVDSLPFLQRFVSKPHSNPGKALSLEQRQN